MRLESGKVKRNRSWPVRCLSHKQNSAPLIYWQVTVVIVVLEKDVTLDKERTAE